MVIKGRATIVFEDGETFDVHVVFAATRDIPGLAAHGRFWSRNAPAIGAKDMPATLVRDEYAVPIEILIARPNGMGIIITHDKRVRLSPGLRQAFLARC